MCVFVFFSLFQQSACIFVTTASYAITAIAQSFSMEQWRTRCSLRCFMAKDIYLRNVCFFTVGTSAFHFIIIDLSANQISWLSVKRLSIFIGKYRRQNGPKQISNLLRTNCDKSFSNNIHVGGHYKIGMPFSIQG